MNTEKFMLFASYTKHDLTWVKSRVVTLMHYLGESIPVTNVLEIFFPDEYETQTVPSFWSNKPKTIKNIKKRGFWNYIIEVPADLPMEKRIILLAGCRGFRVGYFKNLE